MQSIAPVRRTESGGAVKIAHRYHRTHAVTNARSIATVDLAAVRALDAARAIARDWRRLTAADRGARAGASVGESGGGDGGGGGVGGVGGGRTLIACSAGADSTALVLALAAETDNLIVAYIRHDMRPRQETDIDLAQVRDLAEKLSLPFVTADAPSALRPASKNAEAAARRARYHALTDLAVEHACPFVAVGHHADDLLETQIMWFIRGASLRGLGSLRPTRTLSRRVTLIRPMLSVTRDDARGICTLAGVTPVEDRTNADTRRLRAALRQGVLKDLAPKAARRAKVAAALARDAQRVISDRAFDIQPDSGVWKRDILARERLTVIIEAIRAEFRRQTEGVGMDALTHRAIAPVVRAIQDDTNERRVFQLASGVRMEVAGNEVRMTRLKSASDAP